MEKILSYLSSYSEPWLSFGSTLLDRDPTCILLSAVGLLLLFLCYLMKWFSPNAWKNKYTEKRQGTAKRRRKGGTYKGWRKHQREEEEARKLYSIMKSPLRQHCDSTYLRQLLCPDPQCQLCATTSVKVSRLLSRVSLEDAALPASRGASLHAVRKSSCTQQCAITLTPPAHPTPASILEPSLPPPTLSSPSQVTDLSNSLSSLAKAESVPPRPSPSLDCEHPGDYFIPEPFVSQLPINHHTQDAEPVLKPEGSQSRREGSAELYTTDFSSAETAFGAHSTADHIKDGNHLSLSLDIQASIQSEIKDIENLLMCKGEEKETSLFLKRKKSENLLSSTGKTPEPLAGKPDSAHTLPFCTRKGKAGEPHVHLKLPHAKTMEDNLEQKQSQLDHLLALSTESQNTVLASSRDSTTSVSIDMTSSVFTNSESSVLLHIPPLPQTDVQPQPSKPNLSQSLSHNLRPVQDQSQLQPPPSILSHSLLHQDNTSGACFHATQGEVQLLTQSEIHPLEQNALQKKQAHMWGLPSADQKSHAIFRPPPPKLSLPNQECSGNLSENLHQKQLQTSLEKGSKKSGEMQEDKLPEKVQSPWHNINLTQTSPEKPSSQIKDRDLGELVGQGGYMSTSKEIAILSSSKVKLLEEHIRAFHRRMTWGLPHKVQESIEMFNVKEHPSQPFPHSVFLSSDTSVSGVDSKFGSRKPLRGRSDTLQGDKLWTIKSDTDHPHHATVLVSKKGQEGASSQATPYLSQDRRVDIQTREGGRQTFLPPTHRKTDTASEKQTIQDKRHSPNLPARQAGAGPETSGRKMSSGNDIEGLPRKMSTNTEYLTTYNKSKEIMKAQEFCSLKSHSRNILTSEPEDILQTYGNTSKVKSTPSPERHSAKSTMTKDVKPVDVKNQFLNELKMEMKRRNLVQAQGLPTDENLAFKDLNMKSSRVHKQHVSGGDMAASQMLHVQVDNIKNMEQRQDPRLPTHILSKCQENKFPPATKKVIPPAVKTGDGVVGVAWLGTCQCRRRNCPYQVMTAKMTPEVKSSPIPSLKGQPPPKNLFKNMMKDFFQQFCHCINQGGQKSNLEKDISAGQARGLGRRRVAFP